MYQCLAISDSIANENAANPAQPIIAAFPPCFAANTAPV